MLKKGTPYIYCRIPFKLTIQNEYNHSSYGNAFSVIALEPILLRDCIEYVLGNFKVCVEEDVTHRVNLRESLLTTTNPYTSFLVLFSPFLVLVAVFIPPPFVLIFVLIIYLVSFTLVFIVYTREKNFDA